MVASKKTMELAEVTLKSPGVAPGIFRRGADSSDEGLRYGFQGTINAKNLRKNRF